MKRALLFAAMATLAACDDSTPQTPPVTRPDVVSVTDAGPTDVPPAPADVPATTDVAAPPMDVAEPPPDVPAPPFDLPVPPPDVVTPPTDVPVVPVDNGPPPPDAGPPVVGDTCVRDGDCFFDSVGQTCDTTLGRCVECVDGNGCGSGSYCNARRQCVPGCGVDDDCFRSQYCAADNTCQSGCRDDSSCPFSSRPRCDLTSRACVECTADAQCGAGRVCRGGTCTSGCSATVPCAAGQTCCDGTCRNLQTDPSACGACTTRCTAQAGGTPTCTAGACGSACMTGLADCDGNAANGCEVDTRSSVMHCGACRNACPTPSGGTPACNAGRCGMACAAGRADCDGMAANGCEVDLTTSSNCGMCGRACTFTNATGACTAGSCAVTACTTGFGNCDNNGANGCEVDTRTSVTHCGMCGRACSFANAAATCANGACAMGACNAGFADCDGNPANGCEVDTRTSLTHCGMCGRACTAANGTARCTAGACGVATCNAGFSDCDMNAANGCERETRLTCGTCDATCRDRTVGAGGVAYSPAGQQGTAANPMGALVVSASSMTTVADYLWVVNTAESTLSKWDAAMTREIARYRVGLSTGECRGVCCYNNGCNMPSRVVVDGNGDAYVANRAFQFQGTVTKIAGDRANCVDRNNNGVIDTSSGAANVLAYGADECVLWTTNVGASNAVLRALTVDRGDANFPNGYVWVGAYNTRQAFRLNPRTGAVLDTLNLSVQPYGFVVTRDGRLWASTLDAGSLQSVDTVTRVVGAIVPFPNALRTNCGTIPNLLSSYGITADSRGRIWLAGWQCRDALGYDPAMQRWTRVDTQSFVAGWAGRGITVDGNGRVWMNYSTRDDGPSGGLLSWDSNAFVANGTIGAAAITRTPFDVANVFNGPSAIGIDRSGNLWHAYYSAGSPLLRVRPSAMNPATATVDRYAGPNQVYSYSDFTGSVRRSVVAQGSYEETIDLGCDTPTLTSLSWTATTPTGTTITFTGRTAATDVGLGGATPATLAILPRDTSPANLATTFATVSRQLRISVSMQSNDSGASPVLTSFNLRWRCAGP